MNRETRCLDQQHHGGRECRYASRPSKSYNNHATMMATTTRLVRACHSSDGLLHIKMAKKDKVHDQQQDSVVVGD
jgi:hypothetical protein